MNHRRHELHDPHDLNRSSSPRPLLPATVCDQIMNKPTRSDLELDMTIQYLMRTKINHQIPTKPSDSTTHHLTPKVQFISVVSDNWSSEWRVAETVFWYENMPLDAVELELPHSCNPLHRMSLSTSQKHVNWRG